MPQILPIAPTNEQLSSYKEAVIAEFNRYRSGVQAPGLIRGLFGTAPDRINSISAVVDKMDSHDLIFLYNIITEAGKVEERNSRFRDVVGKAALSQFYKYLAGATESLLVIGLLYSLLGQSITGTFFYGSLCFLSDTIEHYFQKGIQHQALINGLSVDADHNNQTELFDFIKRTVSNLSVDKVLTSAQNVASNVTNFVHSNYLFFRSTLNNSKPNETPQPTIPYRSP